MIKNKYQRLSKEEKIDLKKKFYTTDKWKTFKVRYIRILVTGILCIGFAIYLALENYFKSNNVWYYSYSALIVAFGLMFIIQDIRLKYKLLNDYALNDNKKKKNKKA